MSGQAAPLEARQAVREPIADVHPHRQGSDIVARVSGWSTKEEDFLAGADYEWEQGVSFNYAVYVSGTLAGSSAMMARIGPGGYEIGYWLHPAFTGRGEE